MAIPYRKPEQDIWSPTSSEGDRELDITGEGSSRASRFSRVKTFLYRAQKWTLKPVPRIAPEDEPHDLKAKLTLWGVLLMMGASIAFGQLSVQRVALQDSTLHELHSDENFKAKLEEYQTRIYLLKRVRDRYPEDSPQFVDLDKNLGDIERRMQVARRELAELEMADTLPRELAVVAMERQLKQIQSQLRTLEAE